MVLRYGSTQTSRGVENEASGVEHNQPARHTKSGEAGAVAPVGQPSRPAVLEKNHLFHVHKK